MCSYSQVRVRQRLHRAGRLAAAVLLAGILAGGCDRDSASPGLPNAPALQLAEFDPDARAQFDTALSEFRAEPESVAANARLARLLHAYGQLEPAAAYYRRARTIDPGNFALAHLHGLALSKLGAREEAIEALRRASELDADYLPTLLELAALLSDAGDAEASRGYYEVALQVSPNQPQALLGLGGLKQDENPEAALALMRRAATAAGSYGAAHYAIAQVLRDLGDGDGAQAEIEAFERYANQAPYIEDPVRMDMRALNLSRDGHLERALLAFRDGDFETSAREFEESLEKDPDNTMARQNLIAVYGQLGRFEEAEMQYQAAAQSNTNDVKLYTNYALLHLTQKNFEKAIEAYEKAIEIDPAYGKPYIGIGAAHEVQGNREEAMRWYRAALENDPANRQARQYLGAALIKEDSFSQAIEILAPAVLPDDLRSAVYLRLLAQAQAASLDFNAAERSLIRAEELARRFNQADLAVAALVDAEAVRKARSVSGQP